mgnify:CR=1 FL=1
MDNNEQIENHDEQIENHDEQNDMDNQQQTVDYNNYKLINMKCFGSPIKGLVNTNPILGMKECISRYSQKHPKTSYLFVLGPIDIDFNYYNQCVHDNIKHDKLEYIDNLILRYELYLNSLTNNFIVLFPHPSLILEIQNVFTNSFYELNAKSSFFSDIINNKLYEDVDNVFHNNYSIESNELFKTKLKQMCIKKNFKYNVGKDNNFVKLESQLFKNNTLETQNKTEALNSVLIRI